MLSHGTSVRVASTTRRISVGDATVQEAEGAVLAFSVTLSHPSSRTVTVDYATSDGSAQASQDYTAASGTLTFRPGHPSQTIQVPVLIDSEDEDPETMTLTLSNPTRSVLADAEATGTIEESDASSETEETTANTEPTGLPTISGTPEVDQTLTASVSSIGDADGLTNPGFTYQWVAGGSDISGATNSTYFLTSNEQGQTIQVRVTFTDDAENQETLTSIATEAVAARSGNTVWQADMLVIKYNASSIGAASADLFANVEGSGSLEIRSLWSYIPDRDLRLAFAAGVPDADNMTLQVGDLVLEFPAGSSGNGSFKWTEIDVDWEDGETIAVSITTASTSTDADTPAPDQANTPATGVPTISGTPQVEKTLTADTSAIADQDGLTNVSYSYQWIANDGNNDADIEDATDSTYEASNDDLGQTIKVKVTFTDDANNEESLTSEATETVAAKPNTAPTGLPTISGTPQVGETLTADTSGISDAEGLTNVSYRYQWTAGGSDISGATGSSHLLTSSQQGQTVQVKVTFTDDAANQESLTSAETLAVAARPNTAATGEPTISGTPEVEQTLTADTSGISDRDGLTNVSYSYQWIADGTDIDGATGSIYELTSNEQGQSIQVRVSFTDDADNEETLTSAETLAVAAKPNTAAAGEPTISGNAPGRADPHGRYLRNIRRQRAEQRLLPVPVAAGRCRYSGADQLHLRAGLRR